MSCSLTHRNLKKEAMTDLPTQQYLTVLVWKSAGSTDVHPYFSKYGHRVSRKYRSGDVNECEFVAGEANLERRWGVIVR